MSKEHSALPQAIHATLLYFDQFDYPLTTEEVWQWLIVRLPDGQVDLPTTTLEEVRVVLHDPPLTPPLRRGGGPRWREQEGYWFLTGREEIVQKRKERARIGERKWAIARRAVRWLQLVPFIRFVGVCNTVAINNAQEESDIDFFIVVQSGKLWTSRFLASWLLDLLRLRRRGNAITDRACLSFWVSEDALNMESLVLPGGDPYFAYWTEQLVPMLDYGGTVERFRSANAWVRGYLPHALQTDRTQLVLGSPLRSLVRFLWGVVAYPFESLFRSLQKSKMARNVESVQHEQTNDVVISDTVLKFHERDRRKEYRERWGERVRNTNFR